MTSGPRTPRVLVAVDKFKDCLTSLEVGAALARGLTAGGVAGVDVLSVADGGDGTVAAALAAGFEPVLVGVLDALGRTRTTTIAVGQQTAVVEVADICGIASIAAESRDAGRATSYGVGTAVLAAAQHPGVRTVAVALGGSATTDAGAGMLQALGARLLTTGTEAAGRGGEALTAVTAADFTDLHPALREVDLIALADVDNPLTGPSGTAVVFAPQKGADVPTVARLDAALSSFARALDSPQSLTSAAAGLVEQTAAGLTSMPGSGAAGGLGFAVALLGGALRPGASWVLDLIGIDDRIASVDVVVTGEGSFDSQTLRGKLPAAVAARAHARQRPVHVVAGTVLLDTGDPSVRAELERLGVVFTHSLTALGGRDTTRDPGAAAKLLAAIGTDVAARLGVPRDLSSLNPYFDRAPN